jgi:CubicO group peptidase (beta-lactamase class C family)
LRFEPNKNFQTDRTHQIFMIDFCSIKIRSPRFFVACLALTSVTAAAQTPTPAAPVHELAGLWKAKGRFGPDAHGPLTIQRTGDKYLADMMGRVVPAKLEKGELSFDLPANQGTFRGKLEKERIHGHWFRPGTPVNGNQGAGPVSASPVVLKADGPDRWRGEVIPLEDTFTFFLLLEKRPDGSFGAILRNPERDLGTQQGVDRLTREGSVVKLMGKRRDKEQEVATGTYDSENQVITLDFPGRGGAYDFRREGDESDFYPRGKNPGRYTYRAPLARDDGWPAGTLDEENIDRGALEQFVQKTLDLPMNSPDAPQVHGLLIVRNGKLVLEEYFHGENRDKLHDQRSASKSLTAILVGAVMEEGAPLKLTSAVYQVMNGGAFPPDLDPQKRAMTLEDLLTMSSGYFCDDTNDDAPGNEEVMTNQTAEPDYYRYTLNVPMATPPGENSVYCSASPNLALGMVGAATGETPLYSFDRLIAAPLKISRYAWPLDPVGHPYGGGSVRLLPRDFVKLGQLMLNGGTWEGRRILSRDFAARATSRLYHLRNIYYGYLWWSEDYPYKDRVVNAFSARGAGGQTVTVIPELALVIGTHAGSYASRKGMMAASTDPIARSILPAVREAGDGNNAPVLAREFTSPYGASKDGSRVPPKK